MIIKFTADTCLPISKHRETGVKFMFLYSSDFSFVFFTKHYQKLRFNCHFKNLFSILLDLSLQWTFIM